MSQQVQWVPQSGRRKKLARPDELSRLDKLIDWYIKFKPEAGKRIEMDLSPSEVHRVIHGYKPKDGQPWAQPGPEFQYRDRTIVAMRKD